MQKLKLQTEIMAYNKIHRFWMVVSGKFPGDRKNWIRVDVAFKGTLKPIQKIQSNPRLA